MKEDVLKGFKIGADDYFQNLLTQKFFWQNKIYFRQKSGASDYRVRRNGVCYWKFNLNAKLRLLTFQNYEPVKLSPKENQLLRLLALHINDLLPREKALNKIWRDDNYFTSRSMDVYILPSCANTSNKTTK